MRLVSVNYHIRHIFINIDFYYQQLTQIQVIQRFFFLFFLQPNATIFINNEIPEYAIIFGVPSGTGVKAAIWSDWGLPLTAPPQMHTLVVDARKGKFVIPIPGSLFIFVLIFHIKNDENKNPATSASSKQLLRTIFLCLFFKIRAKMFLICPLSI